MSWRCNGKGPQEIENRVIRVRRGGRLGRRHDSRSDDGNDATALPAGSAGLSFDRQGLGAPLDSGTLEEWKGASARRQRAGMGARPLRAPVGGGPTAPYQPLSVCPLPRASGQWTGIPPSYLQARMSLLDYWKFGTPTKTRKPNDPKLLCRVIHKV